MNELPGTVSALIIPWTAAGRSGASGLKALPGFTSFGGSECFQWAFLGTVWTARTPNSSPATRYTRICTAHTHASLADIPWPRLGGEKEGQCMFSPGWSTTQLRLSAKTDSNGTSPLRPGEDGLALWGVFEVKTWGGNERAIRSCQLYLQSKAENPLLKRTCEFFSLTFKRGCFVVSFAIRLWSDIMSQDGKIYIKISIHWNKKSS